MKLETSEHLLEAIIDLKKAFGRVSRQKLIRKLEKLGVTIDLSNHLIIFLFTFSVSTTEDVTSACALLTIGIAKEGTASLELFGVYINDLAGRLRSSLGRDAEGTGPCEKYPRKLVADDVILVAESGEELQVLLDECSAWEEEK